MNSEDSNMAANAICFTAEMVKQEWLYTACAYSRPSTLFKPCIFPDGNRWCALYGEDLQNGVAGFGDTPSLAMEDFDKKWHTQTLHGTKGSGG